MAENSPQVVEEAAAAAGLNGSCSSSSSSSSGCKSNTVFASLFASSTASGAFKPSQTLALTDLMRAMARPDLPTDGASSVVEPFALCLATAGSSIFGTSGQERRQYGTQSQAAMSATALLQKAAQMGATTSNSSLLCGLGLVPSSLSSAQQDSVPWGNNRPIDSENATVPAGLGLGLHCDGSSGLKELMMGTPSVFGPKQPTLDFLGLGMAAGGATPSNCISTRNGGARDVAAAAAPFEGKGGEEIAGNDASSSS